MIYAIERMRNAHIPDDVRAICAEWESWPDRTVTVKVVLGDRRAAMLWLEEGQRHVATFCVTELDALNMWLPDGSGWRRGTAIDLRAALEVER